MPNRPSVSMLHKSRGNDDEECSQLGFAENQSLLFDGGRSISHAQFQVRAFLVDRHLAGTGARIPPAHNGKLKSRNLACL